MKVNQDDLLKAGPKQISKVINQITEEERKRRSFPIPDLTEMELEVLAGIANGRRHKELDGMIRALACRNKSFDSYDSMIKRLIRKFEAVTIAQVVYKAMKTGLIE